MDGGPGRQQRLYASSGEPVRIRGMGRAESLAYYAAYLDFVLEATSGAERPPGSILDVGCGNAWSAYAFATAAPGLVVTGVDLNPGDFEPPRTPGLRLVAGSVMGLPFGDASFDAVASHQMLEHVPDPGRALGEMLRVAKPGGTVVVVSPNLLSVLIPLMGLGRYAWRGSPPRPILRRSRGMPRHPGGNTLPECGAALVRNAAWTCIKLASPRLSFSMRAPDLAPPANGDNDACYWCNPADLVKFFRGRGCAIVRNGAYGRPRWSWPLATGTYVAARKPGGPAR